MRVLLLALLALPLTARASLHVLIIEGLGGERAYAEQFEAEAQAVRKASASVTEPQQIYLIGHGSYDGADYKFNIPGPDISGRELAALLDALPARSQLVVATGSASGALLEPLKRPGRIVISATRNGNERNATHFGSEFAGALTDAAADTDKNGAVSAQEAFDYASRRVKDYFEHEAQLATEHPVIEGENAGLFTIEQLQPVAAGVPAALLKQRAALNSEIEELRLRKSSLSDDDYQHQLEQLLLQLAGVQQQIDAAHAH
jgi:hypothetical protein